MGRGCMCEGPGDGWFAPVLVLDSACPYYASVDISWPSIFPPFQEIDLGGGEMPFMDAGSNASHALIGRLREFLCIFLTYLTHVSLSRRDQELSILRQFFLRQLSLLDRFSPRLFTFCYYFLGISFDEKPRGTFNASRLDVLLYRMRSTRGGFSSASSVLPLLIAVLQGHSDSSTSESTLVQFQRDPRMQLTQDLQTQSKREP